VRSCCFLVDIHPARRVIMCTIVLSDLCYGTNSYSSNRVYINYKEIRSTHKYTQFYVFNDNIILSVFNYNNLTLYDHRGVGWFELCILCICCIMFVVFLSDILMMVTEATKMLVNSNTS